MSLKNSNDTIGNRTRDLPVCSVVPLGLCRMIILRWLLKKPDVRTWTELGLQLKAAVVYKR